MKTGLAPLRCVTRHGVLQQATEKVMKNFRHMRRVQSRICTCYRCREGDGRLQPVKLQLSDGGEFLRLSVATSSMTHPLPATETMPTLMHDVPYRVARRPSLSARRSAPQRRRLFAATIGALIGLITPARAHDAFEIWTIAVLRHDQLEVGITMAHSTALRLIDPQMKSGAISAENFAEHRERLQQDAPTLCILTSGQKPLVAQKVEVDLTEENDIVFKIIYPRPAEGRLHFHARCLRKLGTGYGGIFDASDATGNHLGWEQLSFENPNFEISIPKLALRRP